MASEAEDTRLRIKRKQIEIKKQQAADVAQIDTSPVPFDRQAAVREERNRALQRSPNQFTFGPLNLGEQIKEGVERQEAIAASGVVTDVGEATGRFQTGFAASDAFALSYLNAKLSEKAGVNIPVRVGPLTNEFEVLDPQLNKWKTFDEKGVTLSDMKEMIGPALTYGGDVVGSIIGFLLGGAMTSPSGGGGAVPGEVAGSFTGTTVLEQARLRLGREMGVNVGLTDEEINAISREQGRNAAAGAILARGLFAAGNRILRGGSPFTREQAESIIDASREADAIIAKINERISTDIAPTAGQRSGLDRILTEEANITRDRANIQFMLRATQKQNEQGLVEFYDATFSLSGAGRYEAGTGIQEGFYKSSLKRLVEANEISSKTERQAVTEMGKIPALDAPLAGKDVRQVLTLQREAIKDLEDVAWLRVKQFAGFDEATASSNIQIPRSEGLNKILGSLSAESRKAIIGSEAASKSALISRLVKADKDTITIVDKDGNPLLTITPDASDIDLYQLNGAIKELRRITRISEKGLSREDPTVGDTKRLLKALVDMRNGDLKVNNPELLSEILDAEHITKTRVFLYDRTIVGTFLKEKSGQHVMTDDAVFHAILKKHNADSSKELAGILAVDPRAMQSVREYIYSFYKSEVAPEGFPDIKLHREFMREYEGTIKPFFALSGEFEKINQFGRLGEVVEKHSNQVKRMQERFEKSFRGKVANMNPESIVKAFFGTAKKESTVSFNIGDARKLRNFSQANGTYEQLQATVGDELRRKIIRNGVVDFKALDNVLAEYGEKLGVFMGDSYRRDLHTLLRAKEVVARKQLPTVKPGQHPFIEGGVRLFRAILGPLNPRQRLITAGVDIKATAADIAIYNAISDPARLRELTRNYNNKLTHKNVISLLGSLGAIDLTTEQ